jgi:hypothetical protein
MDGTRMIILAQAAVRGSRRKAQGSGKIFEYVLEGFA